MSRLRGPGGMIVLSTAEADSLYAQARARPREEICGLIGTRADLAHTLYPVPNRLRDPRRFAMDEARQIAAFRHMRIRGERLYAIYHSHPLSMAQPSRQDIAEHAYPEAFCVIVSLLGVGEIRAFKIRAGRAEEVRLQLRPATG